MVDNLSKWTQAVCSTSTTNDVVIVNASGNYTASFISENDIKKHRLQQAGKKTRNRKKKK